MSDNNIKENEELVNEEEKAPEEAKSYDVLIEEARKDLFNAYNKSRKISNILMFSVVVAIVGVMFLIISNNDVLRIVGYVLVGVLVVGMVLYYALYARKHLPNKIKNYVPFVMKTLNDRMFSQQNFKDIVCKEEEKLAMDDLIGDGVYAEANAINSRNIVRGTYKGHSFLYSEAALMRPSSRKQQVPPLFVGRYISAPNQMKFEGRYIVTIKNPKQPLDLPNATSDLVILEDKEDFSVYGPEGSDNHAVVGNKTINYFRRLSVEGHLLNVNIVFWGGHTAVYLSYDDAILSVPFDKEFDKEAFEKSLDDLMTCMNALAGE